MNTIEKQIKKNTTDISILKIDVKKNTSRIDALESFIVPELKLISKKIDNIKMPWFKYIGILIMGSFLTIIGIIIVYGGQV